MIKYYKNYQPFNLISCCDVLISNIDWLIDNQNHKIKIVKDMYYNHRIHNKSTYNCANRTKEEYYYRMIFDELYPEMGREYTVKKWIPRTDWDGVGYDPSGRAQGTHIEKY